jgi:cyclophilin family peptidyl-prolyl cis-trans isomerase
MKTVVLALLGLLVLGGTMHAQPTAPAANPRVALETSKGTIVVELDAAKAPLSVANFLAYVGDGFYDGTIFHRVIRGFMIQGGGFGVDLSRKATHAAIQNEAKNGLRNTRGTLAMARTGDPHSATSQFFINHADNAFLDYPGQDGWGYAVFGHVVEGMDVVDAIAGVRTGTQAGMQDVPMETVGIQRARRLE